MVIIYGAVSRGRQFSDEARSKMIKRGNENGMYGKLGKDNPLYGRKHTEEAKQKMRDALRVSRARRRGEYVCGGH